jgi:hypothetical protein
LQHGLSLDACVEAVLEGLETGSEATQTDASLILTAVP